MSDIKDYQVCARINLEKERGVNENYILHRDGRITVRKLVATLPGQNYTASVLARSIVSDLKDFSVVVENETDGRKWLSVTIRIRKTLTLAEAKALRPGQTLYHVNERGSDGMPKRWRVSGRPKVWKTRPERVEVPIKHGLYSHDYLTEHALNLVTLEEDEAA